MEMTQLLHAVGNGAPQASAGRVGDSVTPSSFFAEKKIFLAWIGLNWTLGKSAQVRMLSQSPECMDQSILGTDW